MSFDFLRPKQQAKPQPQLGFVCDENWAAMKGNEAERNCEQCSCTVFNLDAIPVETACRMIETAQAKGERICVRYTPEEPVSIKARPLFRMRSIAASVAALLAIIPGLSGVAQAIEEKTSAAASFSGEEIVGGLMPPNWNTKIEEPAPPIMGDIAPPEPPPKPKVEKMGIMAVTEKPKPAPVDEKFCENPIVLKPKASKKPKHPVPLMGKIAPPSRKPAVKPSPTPKKTQVQQQNSPVMGELMPPTD